MAKTCYVIVRVEITSTNIYTGSDYEETLEDMDQVLVCKSFGVAVKAKQKMMNETYHKEYAKNGPGTDAFLAGDGSVEIHTPADGSIVAIPLKTITYIEFYIKKVSMSM